MSDQQFILASQSPRRAELLARLGLRFSVVPADIDESRLTQEAPAAYVQRLAVEKAAALGQTNLPVLGADTIVALGDVIMGKPRDRAEGLRMLAQLSGREHEVLTAVCVRQAERREIGLSRTRVSFAPVTPAQAAAYWASGEPQGKAGGYAIQGLAEAFVQEISGSYSGVVGLPVQMSLRLLKLFAIEPPALSAP